VRAPGTKKRRRSAISARLNRHVTLEARADGKIAACFDGYSVSLGTLSAAAADRAQGLRQGLPLASLVSGNRNSDKEIDLLVRRLARHGLLEYRFPGSQSAEDQVVIEPQLADYWPQAPQLGDEDFVVLSRFAYLRRRGCEMVLESPRASALFRICDPSVATTIAKLATPQPIKRLRRQKDFPGLELLALLVDCRILFKVDAAGDAGLRSDEGDDNLVLWDFHDLLFHTRSTEGRHANPLGGVYPYTDSIPPLPAVRPCWPGEKIDLRELSAAPASAIAPLVKLLRDRHSTREFDDQRPITLAELARFLDRTARVLSTSSIPVDGGGPVVDYAMRPYPSAGAEYALELYLSVDKCEGLPRGFYHYDAGEHALMRISTATQEMDALLAKAEFAMGAAAAPQILITIAARFGRVSWKYSSLAYALILKDVGVLMQTFYLTATDMALGGCAIGIANIDLFARLTGIEFHVEGPVGQFAIGHPTQPPASD
jgi:SagB-type dehydrogenase family enzyme